MSAMDSQDFAKKVLRHVWADFSKHFDAAANVDDLFSRELIDVSTLEGILNAQSTRAGNRVFLLHLGSNTTIESLWKLCKQLRDTAYDHYQHAGLSDLLEGQLKQWKIEPANGESRLSSPPSSSTMTVEPPENDTGGSNAPSQPLGAGTKREPLTDAPIAKPAKEWASRPLAIALRKICDKTGTNWKNLLRSLEIEEVQIQTLIEDNPRNTAEACFQGLMFWENENALLPVTWGTLIEALKNAKLTKLANELPPKEK